MKVCIIHGSPRKGNTYKATSIFMETLRNHGTVEFTEFFLPRDLPHFCLGCTNCFEYGEERCPHVSYVQPIVESMRDADGIVLTSPVYVLAASGGMKAFLDHLGYLFMAHRPMEEMFSKVGMILSTAAGGGTGLTNKNMSRCMRFWGILKIYKCGLTIFAGSWETMPINKQKRYEKALNKKAKQFLNSIERRGKHRTPLFTRAMFSVMRRMIGSYSDDSADKVYWQKKGWLEGENLPFV